MARGYSRILIIPDTHCPFEHRDAWFFLKAVRDEYTPEHIIHLGDEIDGNKISMHPKDEDVPFSASSELCEAIVHLQGLYELFPKVVVLESNHGSLIYRRAKMSGIPLSVIKSYNEILEAPIGWTWKSEHICKMSNGRLLYAHHGHTANVISNSQLRSMNYVQGHHHSSFEVRYWSNAVKQFFAVTSGCLVDADNLAFNYGKLFLKKPILGCTMIIDGTPLLIPMILDKHKRWIGRIL